MDNKIEIRCRRANCNKLFMNYFPEGGNNGLCLAGIELKCEKCKRVLRLKNYTEEVSVILYLAGIPARKDE